MLGVFQKKEIVERRKRYRPRRSAREFASDKIAGVLGSWTFILCQLTLCVGWIILNSVLPKPIDPFPFSILANMLQIEGALAASFLLIASNRAAEIEAKKSTKDLKIAEHMQSEMDHIMQELKKD